MSGFIKLWRALRDHELWLERREFSRCEAWIDLLMEASFETRKDSLGRVVERGCMWTTHRKLASRWGWEKTKVSRFLKQLQTCEQVRIRVHRKCVRNRAQTWTYLRISNYEEYQGATEDGAPQMCPQTCPEVSPEMSPFLRRKKEEGRIYKNSPTSGRKTEHLRLWAKEFDSQADEEESAE